MSTPSRDPSCDAPIAAPILNAINVPLDLNEAVRSAFNRDGYVRLKGVFSPDELAPFGAAVTSATIALNTQDKPLSARTTYERAFLQVMNVWRHDELARAFVFGQRLARLAADLLGVRAVRLYHDQSLYKEPGGGITPAHADQVYWPFSSDRAVTAWVPLQDTPDEMGPLGFFPGSHRMSRGRDLEISDHSEREIVAQMQSVGAPFDVAPFALGDVSFHLGWTFHRAGPNAARAPRSVMTIIYMDADMRLTEPANVHQRNDAAQWCPNVAPGEVIASHLNPVLFDRTAPHAASG